MMRNADYSQSQQQSSDKFKSTNYTQAYHTGYKRHPVWSTKRDHHSIGRKHGSAEGGGWNTSELGVDEAPEGHEEKGYKDFPDSSWIEAREFKPDVGIMVIYFRAMATNAKPPVVLGIGDPITWDFVISFDNGIQSKGGEWGSPRANSQGAFYKTYIEQFKWVVNKDGSRTKVPNTKRIIQAVPLDDLQMKHKEFEEAVKNGILDENGNKIRSKHLEQTIYSAYHIPAKNFLRQLSPDRLARAARRHVVGKIKDKIRSMGKKEKTDAVKKVAKGMDMKKIMKGVANMPGALKTISESSTTKNIGRVAGKITKMRKASKAGKLAAKTARAGMKMEAGAALAPETGGLSILIAAGVNFAGNLMAKQKQAKDLSTMFGKTETFGAVQIVAFKRALADNAKLHIKRVGLATLIKGVAQNKSLKWEEKGYLNPRQRAILKTGSETSKIWGFADRTRKRPK